MMYLLTTKNTSTVSTADQQGLKCPQKKTTFLSFKNYHKQMKAPFVVYADCEAVIKPTEKGPQQDTSQDTSYTQKNRSS